MSPRAYFKNIFENVTSIAIGMKITIKYCFQKTVTVQYPEQYLKFAPRYRGIHEFEADRCIACDQCAKACPVDCIYIDKTAHFFLATTILFLWKTFHWDILVWSGDRFVVLFFRYLCLPFNVCGLCR